MRPQPVQAQAAAARLEGDEKSIITVQFPVSNDRVITAMQGIQGVLEAVGLDVAEGRMLAQWLNLKLTKSDLSTLSLAYLGQQFVPQPNVPQPNSLGNQLYPYGNSLSGILTTLFG